MVRPILPIIDYVINKDFIATNLCVNNDKPELDCNGKCYVVNQYLKKDISVPFSTKNSPKIDFEKYPISLIENKKNNEEKFYFKTTLLNFLYRFSIKEHIILPTFPPPKFYC